MVQSARYHYAHADLIALLRESSRIAFVGKINVHHIFTPIKTRSCSMDARFYTSKAHFMAFFRVSALHLSLLSSFHLLRGAHNCGDSSPISRKDLANAQSW